MSLLRFLGKLTGIEGKVEWSRAKKIQVLGPDFYGQYYIFVDPEFNVAILLPKFDKTLHIFVGDIFRAHRWIKCDQAGKKVIDEIPPAEAFEWKINPKNIRYRGTGFPPGRPSYRAKVISSEDFLDEINEKWLDSKIKEYIQMMSEASQDDNSLNKCVLPKKITCPNCSAEIELEESERKKGIYLCPNCNVRSVEHFKICLKCNSIISDVFRCPNCGSIVD